ETRDFGRTIYRIMSGSGRRRANVGGGLRRAKSWRVLILSAGELPAAEYAAQEGRQVRGGQLVRLADVPIDGAPLFRDGGEVDHLKQAFAHHFGHAGPRFIESVTTEKMAEAWRGFDPEAIGPAATPEAVRVRKRFALAACAGELAIKHGLLPWRPGQAIEAARLAYRTWQSGHSAATEGERGIVNLQAFILRHEARFEREDNDPPKERAGWFRHDCYHFTREAFKEALAGANQKATLDLLDQLEVLKKERADRTGNRIGVGRDRVRVFSIRSSILTVETVETVETPEPERAQGLPPSMGEMVETVEEWGKSEMCGPASSTVSTIGGSHGGRSRPKVGRGLSTVSTVSTMKNGKSDFSGGGKRHFNDDWGEP
ncbi:hypothetical protein, partial [Methylohalobius crimeensis]|uniref:hypothetical protein n=1 Tax=Methylohalobius crimeensis TaxID=244365 RepID=UPI0003B42095